MNNTETPKRIFSTIHYKLSSAHVSALADTIYIGNKVNAIVISSCRCLEIICSEYSFRYSALNKVADNQHRK